MMRARWFRHFSKLSVIGLLLGVLWGCGGGGSTPKVLYAVGLDSTGVGIFAVSDYGTLVYTFSVTAGIGSAPSVIAIDPAARFLYVLDSGGVAGAVSQFVLNRNTGTLIQATFSTTNGTTPVAGPIETGVNPKSMAVDITGSLVFVANHGSVDCATEPLACPSVSVFCIDPIGGTLSEMKQLLPPPAGTLNCTQPFSLPSSTPPNCTPTNPVPCPLSTTATGSPVALATTRNLLFVAMANAGSSSIATYTFDLTGSLTPKPPTAPPTTALAGTNPSAMAMDLTGRFLFVADSVANTVAAFSIGSSGQLTPVGAPVATGTNPVSVRVHPSGAFLYTANRDSNDISAFSIDTSGALKPVPGSPFAVGRPGPSFVTTDAAGGLLFVTAAASPPLVSNTISVFVVEGSGALQEVIGSPFNSVVLSPVALASIN
jgi:6-phosphogluconolactonase (cycloisomerase 2 family)